jgi:hypothetical protein
MHGATLKNRIVFGSSPSGSDALLPYNIPFVPHNLILRLNEPCSFTEVSDGPPILGFVTSSESKKKEPRRACLSEAKAFTLTQNLD